MSLGINGILITSILTTFITGVCLMIWCAALLASKALDPVAKYISNTISSIEAWRQEVHRIANMPELEQNKEGNLSYPETSSAEQGALSHSQPSNIEEPNIDWRAAELYDELSYYKQNTVPRTYSSR